MVFIKVSLPLTPKGLCFDYFYLAFGFVYIVIESPHMIVHLRIEF